MKKLYYSDDTIANMIIASYFALMYMVTLIVA